MSKVIYKEGGLGKGSKVEVKIKEGRLIISHKYFMYPDCASYEHVIEINKPEELIESLLKYYPTKKK